MKKIRRSQEFEVKILLSVLLWMTLCLPLCAQSAEGESGTQQTSTQQNSGEEQTQRERRQDILRFGLESDITELLSTLIRDKNSEFTPLILELFDTTKSTAAREKILDYCIAVEEDGLKEYAVAILEDPYDERKSLVNMVFRYAGELKIAEAAEPIRELLKNENEDYQDIAIRTLGRIGGSESAVFLSEYLDRDLSLAMRQTLVRALGELKAVDTWDKLVELAENDDENTYVRMYAAEAIGQMEKPESADILIELFSSADPNLRAAIIRGLSWYDTSEAKSVILDAFRDNHYKVRLEAANAAEKLKMTEAVSHLIYRGKNDPEQTVKLKCFETIAVIGTKEAVDYLVSVIADEKMSDTLRAKAAAVMLEHNFDTGIDSVLAAAEKNLGDDKKKNLRYALGREFAKYENPRLADICSQYMASKDVSTAGIGLDIYAKNRFPSLTATVESIAGDEKRGALYRKAKNILEG